MNWYEDNKIIDDIARIGADVACAATSIVCAIAGCLSDILVIRIASFALSILWAIAVFEPHEKH